ncbi:MAG: hypothetical protein BroJett029_04910 [Alphaproteobacteria bacterium]|nr:MAG: hypothetical protein BroJett029_04910 [Alphaproteobacteria bacterium]
MRLIAPVTWVLLVTGVSRAEADSGYLIDHGVEIYYALVPAEMIRGHSENHPEGSMHGGVPDPPNACHLMVALFDASSLERIIDADVTAMIAEAGLSGTRKTLEPFTVADALTYGNYFERKPRTSYRVRIDATVPGRPTVARVEFDFRRE